MVKVIHHKHVAKVLVPTKTVHTKEVLHIDKEKDHGWHDGWQEDGFNSGYGDGGFWGGRGYGGWGHSGIGGGFKNFFGGGGDGGWEYGKGGWKGSKGGYNFGKAGRGGWNHGKDEGWKFGGGGGDGGFKSFPEGWEFGRGHKGKGSTWKFGSSRGWESERPKIYIENGHDVGNGWFVGKGKEEGLHGWKDNGGNGGFEHSEESQVINFGKEFGSRWPERNHFSQEDGGFESSPHIAWEFPGQNRPQRQGYRRRPPLLAPVGVPLDRFPENGHNIPKHLQQRSTTDNAFNGVGSSNDGVPSGDLKQVEETPLFTNIFGGNIADDAPLDLSHNANTDSGYSIDSSSALLAQHNGVLSGVNQKSVLGISSDADTGRGGNGYTGINGGGFDFPGNKDNMQFGRSDAKPLQTMGRPLPDALFQNHGPQVNVNEGHQTWLGSHIFERQPG